MSYFTEPDSLLQMKAISAVLPVMLTVVFYSLYWFVASSGRLKERVYSRYEQLSANVIHVVLKRSAGFLLLGVLPLVVMALLSENFSPADAGIRSNPETMRFTVLSIALLSLLVIPIVFFSAGKPAVYTIYPEIRASRWTWGLLLAETTTWAVYLLGYEILFRGVLLFGLAHTTGPVAATVINVILYSAAHLPKGKTETVAAIPFGIILCILTLQSGTIWIAFLVHLVNALTTTFTAIRSNPEMSYSRKDERASIS